MANYAKKLSLGIFIVLALFLKIAYFRPAQAAYTCSSDSDCSCGSCCKNGACGGCTTNPCSQQTNPPPPLFNCAQQACPSGQCCTSGNGGCGPCTVPGTTATLSCANFQYDVTRQLFNAQISPGTCGNEFGHPVVEAVGVDSSQNLVERTFNYPLAFCPVGTTISCSLTNSGYGLIREAAPNGKTGFGNMYVYTCTDNSPNSCTQSWNVMQPLPSQINDNYSYELYMINQSDNYTCQSQMCTPGLLFVGDQINPSCTLSFSPASPTNVNNNVTITRPCHR